MTAAPPPASAYRAPGEATPPPRGRALPSTTLIGFVGCGGGRMPPPSGVAGFRRGGRRALPPLGCRVCCLGRGLGSGSGSWAGSEPGLGWGLVGWSWRDHGGTGQSAEKAFAWPLVGPPQYFPCFECSRLDSYVSIKTSSKLKAQSSWSVWDY